MADSDIVERLEKQIEGSNLALAAVAEVLQKMDSRLTKAEDEEFEMSQEEEDNMEKQEIIKAVASEVFGLIKADSGNPTGAQWGVSDKKASSMKGTGQGDDSENAVTIDSKTENVQSVIQAMQKQLELLKESVDEDGYGFSKENGFPPADDDDEDEDDDDDEEEEFPEEVQEMAKQIANLQKMVSKKNGNVRKMIASETENRLRKMGFQEENGLNKPRLIQYGDNLGVDGSTPIRKASSNPDETVDQMMQMSYSELRRLQEQIESGNTDGVPRELLG